MPLFIVILVIYKYKIWETAVHLAVAGDVFYGVFLCCPFSPLDVLNEIWDLIESFSEGFPTYSTKLVTSVGHLTRKSGVLGSIPGLATYFRFSFRFFKKGSCQLLAKVCARSTG